MTRSRCRGWGGAAVALALLAGACAPRPAPLPMPAPAPAADPGIPGLRVATDGGQEIPVVRGSYCWSASGRSICADAVAPPELVASLEASAVPRESIVSLRFDRRPTRGTIEVRRWTGDGSERVRFVRPGGFALPKKPGEYVYSVFARWAEGDVTWAFRVRVTEQRA